MYSIYGFRDTVRGEYLPVTSIRDKMTEMARNVRFTGEKEYRRLLEREIVSLVDSVCMNGEAPPDMDFVAIANKNLEKKISSAIQRGVPTEYNLRLEVKVIIAPDYSVYYSVTCANKTLRSAAHSEHLEPFHAKGEKTQNAKIWQELEEFSKATPPMGAVLYPTFEPARVDIAKMTFPSVKARAKKYALANMKAFYMQCYMDGAENLPPDKMVELFDMAQEAAKEDGTGELVNMTKSIEKRLVSITVEFLTPKKPVPQEQETGETEADEGSQDAAGMDSIGDEA